MLNKQQQQMVLDNEKLIHFILNKHFTIRREEYEDFFSMGRIALINAVKNFDESKSKFSTYATKVIINEINTYFRKNDRKGRNVIILSLDEEMSNENSLTLRDKIADHRVDIEEEIARKEFFERGVNLILNFFKSDRRTCMLYYLAGYTQENIAKILQKSQPQIGKTSRTAIKELRKHLEMGKQVKNRITLRQKGEVYEISFSKEVAKGFNKVFQNFKDESNLMNFLIEFTEEGVEIVLPAEKEAFALIAKIILEMDKFSKNLSTSKNNCKACDAEQENTKIKESVQVKEYILTLERFKIKDLRKRFPGVKSQILNNVIYTLKKMGKIVPTGVQAEYIVNKN